MLQDLVDRKTVFVDLGARRTVAQAQRRSGNPIDSVVAGATAESLRMRECMVARRCDSAQLQRSRQSTNGARR